MKNILKRSIKITQFKLRYYSVKKSWKKRFSNTVSIESRLTNAERKLYISKWSKIFDYVELHTVSLSKGLTGEFNVDIVPEVHYALIIESCLNNLKSSFAFLENKSLYEKWFGKSLFPEIYIHNINGKILDESLNCCSSLSVATKGLSFPNKYIVKPNIDSYGGKGVSLIKSYEQLVESMSALEKNYIVQEYIELSEFMKIISQNHFCSVRVCTYYSPSNSKVSVLNSTLRIGFNGSLDNETSGGMYLAIDNEGRFSDYALNKQLEKFYYHPNSQLAFKGNVLPNYNELLALAEKLALQVPMVSLISFDFVLDKNDNWRPLELNLIGQTTRFSQYFGKPFFGRYTDEVINTVKQDSL